MYNKSCLTLQQFAKRDYSQVNIILNFAPGKHFIEGGLEFNNTANIVIIGQLEGLEKPKIKCLLKSCFSIRNSSKVYIENLEFSDCFSEDSDGGAVFVSESKAVSISQCSFVNNFIRKRGGAMRLQLIENVYILESQFINNSAICHPSEIFSFFGLSICLERCTASSGAISAFNITEFSIEHSLFESNTASCFNGAVTLSAGNVDLVNNSFVRNSATTSLGSGGGILVFSGSIHLSDCTFEGNHAGYGGGIHISDSTIMILNCSFLLNTASNFGGGAAYFTDTSLLIDETTFNRNMARVGGCHVDRKYKP